MPSGRIDVWFDFASTYTYPLVMRIDRVADARQLAWKPFLLGAVFNMQGLADSPFNIFPAKGRYMWRDLERTCAQHDVPFRKPSVFPRNDLLASRITLACEDQPWIAAFIREVFVANFRDDRDIGERTVIAELLAQFDIDADDIIRSATTDANKALLKKQTQTAVDLGIFGSPTMIVGGEMFWGNDRLEQAVAWSRGDNTFRHPCM